MTLRHIALAAFLSLAACNPVDEVADESADRCQEIIDEQIPPLIDQVSQDVWEQCTSYYEDEVLPQIHDELDQTVQQLIDELTMLFDERLQEAEVEVMTRMGCVPSTNTAGWDCTGTFVCN